MDSCWCHVFPADGTSVAWRQQFINQNFPTRLAFLLPKSPIRLSITVVSPDLLGKGGLKKCSSLPRQISSNPCPQVHYETHSPWGKREHGQFAKVERIFVLFGKE